VANICKICGSEDGLQKIGDELFCHDCVHIFFRDQEVLPTSEGNDRARQVMPSAN
jgi:hypothetical protein